MSHPPNRLTRRRFQATTVLAGGDNASRLVGPAALPETGFTAKAVLTSLPAGQDIFYREYLERPHPQKFS
jgi:phosphodiesterase/alkaline phosphatase D-like protein